MTWNVRGQILIACNCDYGCPCNFNARPSRGHCEGGWIWTIEGGSAEEVPLDGLNLALFASWPGAIHEGGGRAVSYVDERANDAQRDVLAKLARGEFGGPWAIFINTYELDGPHAARFDTNLAEHATTVKIGDIVDLQIEPIRNPVSGAEVHPEMVLPEGLVVKRASLAASRVFTMNDGLSFDHSGQYTAFGPYEYAS